MKTMYFIIVQLCLILAITFGCQQESIAQTKIGDLYYSFSGTEATVEGDPSYHGRYYENDCYIIPETVDYQGLNFTVTVIGDKSFGSGDSRYASKASKIILPNTIQRIGGTIAGAVYGCAFGNCKYLVSMILPSSVTYMERYCFDGCDLLRTLIYLRATPPYGWTATSQTYVPDIKAYNKPSNSINNAKIIEMITFAEKEFTYTGQAPTTTWTNNVEGYSASLSLSSLNYEVGDYEEWVPVTFTKGDESFTTDVVYRYTIKPAQLKVSVNNTSRIYGEENPVFNLSYSGFVNGENESALTKSPVATTNATKTSNVGNYPIYLGGGEAKNYEFVYEQGELTITKASLSAKVNDATKVYGSNNPMFAISYYGLKNNETAPAWTTQPTFQTDATQYSNVGQYPIHAVNGVPINYDLGEITDGTLSVTPAPLTIKANDVSRKYYSENPSFSYACSGFVNADNQNALTIAPTLTTSATISSKVGEYEIKASGAASTNYSISYISGTLSITPCTLLASVGNYERAYNEENPEFVIVYNGFAGNEDESVLSTKPIASTIASKTSDVGIYPINVSGGYAENYNFTYTPGRLTINKAEQTIIWEQDLSNLKVGDQIELTAYVSSSLPITYSMDNYGIAEIYRAGNKTYLDCLKSGEFILRAVNDGNINYYSSPRSSKTVTITDLTGITEVKDDNDDNNYPTYDTMGRKINSLKKGQLYIRQGKKFIVR